MSQNGHELTLDLDAIVEPLREKQRAIDDRIGELERELEGLRVGRRRLDRTIALLATPLDAPLGHSKGGRKQGAGPTKAVIESNATKERNLRAYVDEHARKGGKLADGFTATELERQMRDDGVEPVMSPSFALRLVEQLHAEGILRADHKVRGGATHYKLIAKKGT